jgi:hypothetical protein
MFPFLVVASPPIEPKHSILPFFVSASPKISRHSILPFLDVAEPQSPLTVKVLA